MARGTNAVLGGRMHAPRSRLIVSASATFLGSALAAVPASAQDSWSHPAVDDAPPASQPAPRFDMAADARRDTAVVVHIDAPEPVELQRRDANDAWQAVCSSPCDRPLAEHALYRVAGEGLRPSSDISLAGHGERITLDARPSSSGWFTGGIVLVSVGGASVGTGAFVATVVASLQGVSGASDSHDSGDPASTTRAGIVLMVVGTVAVATGIVAIVSNRSTTVRVLATPTPQEVGAPAPAGPTWTASSRIEMGWPAAMWTPVFTARF